MTDNCKTMSEIQLVDEVYLHRHEIYLIAQGHNLWDVPELISYREKYTMELASFPTTTQSAERGVKTSNHCTLSNRDEQTRSVYATSKSEITKKTKIEMVTNKGKIVKDRSKKRGIAVIKYIVAKATTITAAAAAANSTTDHQDRIFSINARKKTKTSIMSKTGQYKEKRHDDTMWI